MALITGHHMDETDQSCDADPDRSHPAPIPSPQSAFAEATADKGGGESAPGHPSPHAEIPWGEVRRVYELTATPTIEILQRYGLTESQLRWRRQSEKWEARPPAAVQRAKGDAPERLRARLLSLFAVLASRFENWVAGTEEFEAMQASTFAVLATGFAQLMRSDEREEIWMARHAGKPRTATAPREKKNNDAGYDFRDDPAWLDAEIDRRIERLSRIVEAEGTEGAIAGGAAGEARSVG